MPARLLVSVGTDGSVDWVKLPTGEKLLLGSVSVLQFVAKLAKNGRSARGALDGFVQNGEALLMVDESRMWEVLAPKRARWSKFVGPFMSPDPHTREEPMSTTATIQSDLAAIEQHVEMLNKYASAATPEKRQEGFAILEKLAGKIKSPNQSKNNTYYNLGAPDVHEVGDKLAFDTHKANTETAGQILAKAEETVAKIEVLASAGRKFNASKAKADVHEVTSKVAGILRTDLTQAWVAEDLQKLAAKNEQLHTLFASAK